MAIAFESISQDNLANDADTAYSIALPSGTADGDLLVAILTQIARTPTAPDGSWSTLFTADNNFSVFYKIASSESGPYAFGSGGNFAVGNMVLCRISGADVSTDPAQNHITAPQYETEPNDTFDATLTCPAKTPNEAGSLFLWIGSHITAASCSASKGDEEIDNDPAYGCSLAVYSSVEAGTSEVAGADLTWNTASNDKRALTLVIEPTAGATGNMLYWLRANKRGNKIGSGVGKL